jgi:hypothetical protein
MYRHITFAIKRCTTENKIQIYEKRVDLRILKQKAQQTVSIVYFEQPACVRVRARMCV